MTDPIDILILLAQNGWTADILPAWTTCRELFCNETFTERVNAFFEERYDTHFADREEVYDLAAVNECCEERNYTGDCWCVDIASWHMSTYADKMASFESLLCTRKEFFPN